MCVYSSFIFLTGSDILFLYSSVQFNLKTSGAVDEAVRRFQGHLMLKYLFWNSLSIAIMSVPQYRLR